MDHEFTYILNRNVYITTINSVEKAVTSLMMSFCEEVVKIGLFQFQLT